MKPETEDIRRESSGLSELLLSALLAASASWYIFLLPYGSVGRVFATTAFDTIATLLLLLSPAVTLAIMVVDLRSRRRKELQLIELAHHVEIVPRDNALRQWFEKRGLTATIIGNPDTISDQGGAIVSSPRLVELGTWRHNRLTILVPAMAYARLRGEAAALDAVLAHECGHAANRDLFWLVAFERFLLSTLWFVPIAVSSSILSSTVADWQMGNGFGRSMLGSLLGKSSVVALPILAIVSMGILSLAGSYREALADAFAERVIGRDALERAETLLSGGRVVGRQWRRMTSDDVLYGWRLAVLFGFVLGSVASYSASPFAYWQSVLTDGALSRALALVYAVLSIILPYLGAFGLARLLLQRSVRPERADLFLLLLFAISITAGFTLPQTAPGMLTDAPIFNEFSNIYRSEPLNLLFATLAEGWINSICAVATGGLFAMASKNRNTLIYALMGIAVATLGIFEPVVTEGRFYGLLSFVLGGGLCFWALTRVWLDTKPLRFDFGTAILLTFTTTTVVASWFGVGGPGTIAISFQAAADRASLRGDFAEAERHAQRAASFAPFTPTGYINLGRLQAINGRLDDAIESFERGLKAPYLYDWIEIFSAQVLTANAYLDRRRPNDWEAAASHLHIAREMWQANGKLPPQEGVVAFYNSAVVESHLRSDSLLALSWLCDAVALARSIDVSRGTEVARLALGDADLSLLRLDLDEVAPNYDENIARLTRGNCHAVSLEYLSAGESAMKVMGMLRLTIRRAAEGPAGIDSQFSH